MQFESRKIVVLAPIKNESWILENFLIATSVYADHIILGDHYSTDDSVQIAKKFEKAVVLQSAYEGFSESQRRNELLVEARKFGFENLIIALDADEMLSPEFARREHMERLLVYESGTRFQLPHLNVLPGWKYFWRVSMPPVAFIDDGSLHPEKYQIHFPRIPVKENAPLREFGHQGMIHLQYVDWKRMESKHRWYRVWEKINIPGKSQLEIFRRYNHMNNVPRWKLKEVPTAWNTYFSSIGIELKNIGLQKQNYWWDAEVDRLILENPDLDFSLLSLNANSSLEKLNPKQGKFVKYLRLTSFLESKSWFLPARLVLRALDRLVKNQFS